MDDFKDQVKKGFQKCKLDIDVVIADNSKLRGEVERLRNENNSLNSTITQLSTDMNDLKAELKGINIALDYIKNFNTTNSSTPIQQVQPQTPVQVQEPIVEQRLVVEPPRQVIEKPQKVEYKDPYEALMAFKARTNKRELLKQKMMSFLEEGDGMILAELKFLFVDHYKYCSKASFYNYLKEAELEKVITIKRDSGKNRIYLAQPKIMQQKSHNFSDM